MYEYVQFTRFLFRLNKTSLTSDLQGFLSQKNLMGDCGLRKLIYHQSKKKSLPYLQVLQLHNRLHDLRLQLCSKVISLLNNVRMEFKNLPNWLKRCTCLKLIFKRFIIMVRAVTRKTKGLRV